MNEMIMRELAETGADLLSEYDPVILDIDRLPDRRLSEYAEYLMITLYADYNLEC